MSYKPVYPVYIPSKGRWKNGLTTKMFDADNVDYRVVVEPQEVDHYAEAVGEKRVLSLPDSGRGLTFSRNWIKDHATAAGHARHWQFDDDIYFLGRVYRGYRLRCAANVALAAAEDFCDRYENVAVASFNSQHFILSTRGMGPPMPPFYLNQRCYTMFLVNNEFPNKFRGAYNEDTDFSLQALASGWCTILFNVFTIKTPATMVQSGGQTEIYMEDGRLKMARDLERVWPGVVTTGRRFKRPQHFIKDSWRKFDTPLKKKPGLKIPKGTNEYGLKLEAVGEVKSETLKKLLEDQ